MKNKLSIYAFIEGGVVMLLEISSALIVAPVLGASLTIWMILISVSISGLACGYFLGGKLSIKSKTKEWNQIHFLFALTSISIIIGIVFANLTNKSTLLTNYHFCTYIIISFILFIPLVLLGATSPLLTSIYSGKGNNAGTASGYIYATSTSGGIFFALLTGFYLLPELGIQRTLLLGLVPISSMAIYFYFLKKKYFISIIVFLGLIVTIFAPYFFPAIKLKNSHFKVIDYQEGIMGQLLVVDISYDAQADITHRMLFINRMGQTWINKSTGYSNWSYPNYITSLGSMYAKGSKGLVLGLGGGIVAKQLSEINQFEVDGVELDERIIVIAKKYFNLNSSLVKVYNDDARHFIKRSRKKYDFIVFDLFNGEVTPSHSLSLETFIETSDILSPEGMVVINFNGFISGKNGLATRSICKTMIKAGYQVEIFATDELDEANRNILIIGHLKPIDLNKITMHVKLANKEEYRIKDHLMDIKKIDLDDALIITDDKPMLEWINQASAVKWRADYYMNFTLKFKEEAGIPLFN